MKRKLTERGNRDVSTYLKDLGIQSVKELSLYCGLGVRQLHDWFNNKPLAFKSIAEGYLYNNPTEIKEEFYCYKMQVHNKAIEWTTEYNNAKLIIGKDGVCFSLNEEEIVKLVKTCGANFKR